ncbi:MAG: alanine--glyoxylate aminotransferase family protein [Immundisolibacteraceae bacterium]|nr:alanine--glyoxylate aminotransferase family protein [Immundisolibacteraceae bacterium]
MSSFNPPARTLMGPGPADIHPRVLSALSRPIIGHLDPAFQQMMEELKTLLRNALQTGNDITYPVSAPGSAGMETCFANLMEPGDKVIICRNGVFGSRMQQNVERMGGIAVMVDDPWGRAIDPQKLRDALHQNPDAKLVAMVHAETSTGAVSDVKTLVALAHEHGCLTIVDAVTSLGGIELAVDDWGIDALYSGSQKCLSCVPGLSPVTFNQAALDRVAQRPTPVQSWFLDLNLVLGYWQGDGGRSYHHTAPINALYALHESLTLLEEEGIQNAWARHQLHHQALRDGLEAMGLGFQVPAAERLPQLNAVFIPEGINDAEIRTELLNDYGLEIGAGLGEGAGKVWRIGLMGYSARRQNVLLCLSALESVLGRRGVIETGAALAAADKIYQGS